MSIYSEQITPATAFDPASPLVSLGFEPDEWVIRNDGTTDVEYSFDGINVHGQIPAATPNLTEALAKEVVKSKYKKLWIQDGAGTGTVRIQAQNL